MKQHPIERIRRRSFQKHAAVVLAALAFAVAAPSVHAAQFKFKQDQPAVGTSMRYAIGSASIPLDKGYGQLSQEERARVREAFPKLHEADEPPAPERALRPLITFASNLRFRLHGDARVKVVMQVDESGTARHLATPESNNDDLVSAVVNVLAATKFKPASCGGKPCAMEFPFEMELEEATQISR